MRVSGTVKPRFALRAAPLHADGKYTGLAFSTSTIFVTSAARNAVACVESSSSISKNWQYSGKLRLLWFVKCLTTSDGLIVPPRPRAFHAFEAMAALILRLRECTSGWKRQRSELQQSD